MLQTTLRKKGIQLLLAAVLLAVPLGCGQKDRLTPAGASGQESAAPQQAEEGIAAAPAAPGPSASDASASATPAGTAAGRLAATPPAAAAGTSAPGSGRVEWLDPTLSAASPGTASAPSAEVMQALKKGRKQLAALPLAEAAAAKEIQVKGLDYTLLCESTSEGSLTVKACRIGRGMNMVEGQALYWFEGGAWKVQLYPQAAADTAKARLDYFAGLGSNCPVGCAGGFKQLRLAGNELAAVVDLSAAGTRTNMELQLLRRKGETWEIVWVPSPDQYPHKGQVSVELPPKGTEAFSVVYQDGSKQEWRRSGDAYKAAGQ